MNLLSVNNLSKSYGDRVLFTKISFGINEGDKVALVAKNGSGKSTLFKILKGKEIADSGDVVFRKDITVSFLDQDIVLNEELSIIDHVFSADNKLTACIKNYEKALKLSEEGHASAANLLESALRDMNEQNAWDYEKTIKEILSRLELHDVEQKIKTLSGGQKKRLALAQVLINKPDLLIMDEPTNHLDIDMIEWLEHYIAKEQISILLVTHDRYFLDEVCNTVIELDGGKLFEYKGNYEYFVVKKAEREQMLNAEIDKARNLYRRELEWVRKMPKARGTKAKARVDAFDDVAQKAKQKRIDKQVELSVKMERLGSKILELVKISKSFGAKKILEPFTYTFKKGEKIGIIGKNGVGKSTFLNILQGIEQVDSGKVQTGETVVFGYYSQAGIKVSEDKRVIEVVRDIADFIPLANGTQLSASQLLTRFNFPPDMQYNYVSKLSGGEKRRLYLLTVLQKNPNFLILDEPTNDLDIVTLQVLEEFLADFGGCVLIVSHDRYFIDKLVDHVFVFEGNGVIKDYPGNYTEYREWKQEQKEESKLPKVEPEPVKDIETKPISDTKRLSYKEQRELELIEKEIGILEKKKVELENSMGTTTAYEALQKLSNDLKINNETLEEKTMRWLELQEKMA
ncbi:MAG: ABC-F family ATP-binding cassette domain-containing protein [Bacteroidetes bacterium]|nr:ABC-F family ATP-binding cassette domain-containing protein [Bacteroidota bacterium]